MYLFGRKEDPPQIEILLDERADSKYVKIHKDQEKSVALPLYAKDDKVSGRVSITSKEEKSFEHLAINIELLGKIECGATKKQSYDFLSLCKEFEPAGVFTGSKTYDFCFDNFEKPFESYYGDEVNLR